MVFKAKNAHTFKLRVVLADRRYATCSTGTTDRQVANDVEAMVGRLRSRRRWDVLEAVVLKQLTLARVYDADQAGTLETLMAELKDVDLDPLVKDWAVKANAKYVRQVRQLIPAGEKFPLSRFRPKVISKFLADLPCDDPTRNRYRAALSQFAKWLREQEVLETNPVRDVEMYKEHDPRMVWMTWDVAETVAQAAPRPLQELFALMAFTGIELGAALRLTRADVDLSAQTIHARGSKTPWRNRVVRYDRNRVQGYAYRATAGVDDASLLFPGIGYTVALDAFKVAQAKVGVSGHRLHDLRHTYAVNALKAGLKPQVVAHQLGHKDAAMVNRNYGRFVPDAADYKPLATKSATKPRAKGKVTRAK